MTVEIGPEGTLAAPGNVRFHVSPKSPWRESLRWNRVPGAYAYQVQWRMGDEPYGALSTNQRIGLEERSQILPGNGSVEVGLRVRGYSASKAGLWSELLCAPGPRGLPALSVHEIGVHEDKGSIVFTVTLDRRPWEPVTVQYATRNGSARAGSDYEATTGALAFAQCVEDEPCETEKKVLVPISTTISRTTARPSGWS